MAPSGVKRGSSAFHLIDCTLHLQRYQVMAGLAARRSVMSCASLFLIAVLSAGARDLQARRDELCAIMIINDH
jgi:hypothetical protein